MAKNPPRRPGRVEGWCQQPAQKPIVTPAVPKKWLLSMPEMLLWA
jgi:hypothetical protein